MLVVVKPKLFTETFFHQGKILTRLRNSYNHERNSITQNIRFRNQKPLFSANNCIYHFRVTELVIKKPDTFKHSAGDWVFIKVPKITQFEWHPFTISSAPERDDAFTLHIRGVGNWTNSLYKHFEDLKTVSGRKSRSQSIQR